MYECWARLADCGNMMERDAYAHVTMHNTTQMDWCAFDCMLARIHVVQNRSRISFAIFFAIRAKLQCKGVTQLCQISCLSFDFWLTRV